MVRDIGKWLEELKLGQYATAFAENDVDEDLLFELSDDDLVKLGITSLGHRKRLFKGIEALKPLDEADDRPPAGEPPVASRQAAAEAERRQLTVMFCDLVGSTELSGRLDPEDLREVLQRYQDAVTSAVVRYGGHVGQYLGDGVLVYFGWPQAYEDQAERAIWAGLDAIAAVKTVKLNDNSCLDARVGVASGPVVIGKFVDYTGREVKAVTGKTPNLAARLQGLAGPGQMVIDADTRRLVGTAFKFEDDGPHDLKGFAEPVSVWHVVGRGQAESRFEAAHPGHLSPFIGRVRELDLIQEHWSLAKNAKGRVVMLSGEAGIGKSRTLQAFCDAIAGERYSRLSCQCSPYHTNSAFHPIIESLERLAGFGADDDGETRLDRLEELLRVSPNHLDSEIPLFAELLSLPVENRYGAIDLSPQQIRDRTIDALIDRLVDMSLRRPILLVLEDAHWIDPTTETLIGKAMEKIADAPVLMLITHRPDYTPQWPDLPQLAKIDLHKLSRKQGANLVQAAGGDDLAKGVVAEILTRADGVPIFIEELTKSLLESDATEAEIPVSLQASLVARLDRLGNAAKVAQLAAVLGRSFHYRFIRAVSDLGDAELHRALDAMTGSEMLSQTGAPPGSVYAFRHALIQDAAYETLLKSKRARYHGKIADVLLQEFADQAAAEPEVVARHLSLAALPARAVEFWLRAGQRASERSAHVEAVAHLEKGLRQLELLPESPSRDEQELALRVTVGASLATLKGWSAPEVEVNYQRAHKLSESGSDMRKFLLALGGLANVFMLKGEVKKARELADEEVTVALEQNDTALLLRGYRFVGLASFLAGEFDLARENLRRGSANFDRSAHQAKGLAYSTDPAVLGLCIIAWNNWFLGDFDQAHDDINAALELSEELQHPFSLAYAQSFAASIHQVSRNPAAVLIHAEAAIALSEKHDFPYWLAWSTVMLGWAQSALGDPDGGMKTLKSGLEQYENTGARQIKPYILTLLAEMYGKAGKPKKGIRTLAGAYGPGNTTEVQFYEAEAIRLHGELLHQIHPGDGQEYFDKALALARNQGARALELRTVVSIARTSIDGRNTDAAGIQLADILRSLDGADPGNPDRLDARRLLDAIDAG